MGAKPVIENITNITFSVITDASKEIGVQILGYANKEGLDLQNYRNQVLVCKLWREMAINSIIIIDLIMLKQTTVHRKCTLLAHIFADYPIHRFPNLKSLKISFANIDILEFYNKLIDVNKRDFKKEKEYFSADKRLDKIENNMIKNTQELNEIIRSQENWKMKVIKAIPGLCSVGWDIAWYSKIASVPIAREERTKQTTKIYRKLEKEIITCLADLLKIARYFQWNISFAEEANDIFY